MVDERRWKWVLPAGRAVLFVAALVGAGYRLLTGSFDATSLGLLAFAGVILLFDQADSISFLSFKMSGVRRTRRQVVAQAGDPAASLRAAKRDLEAAAQELAVARGFAQGTTIVETVQAAFDRGLVPSAAPTLARQLATLYDKAADPSGPSVKAGLAQDYFFEASALAGVLRQAARAS